VKEPPASPDAMARPPQPIANTIKIVRTTDIVATWGVPASPGVRFQIASDLISEASELTLQTPREQVKNTACSRAWDNPVGVWRGGSDATERDAVRPEITRSV
jgi:hypothetical protein